jgi:hypothetical protein
MTYVIGHLLLPRYASWNGDSSDPGSGLLGYDHDGGEDFGGDVSGFEHEGFRAVLQRCLGMEIIYGGEDGSFSSLRAKDAECPILNLEQGRSVPGWGRMIFYVADVDAFWEHLRGKGLQPESPRDASWGELYFHMPHPDGHESSFARPI